MKRAIESGQTLSNVIAQEIRSPPAISSIISSGEYSGNLGRSLKLAHGLLERQSELISKSMSAMTYPVVIGVIAVILTIALIRGVMPQIIPLLRSLKVDLPIITKIVIALSDGLMNYGLIAMIVTVVAMFGISVLYRKVRVVRILFQGTLMKLPIIGGLCHKYAVAIFLQSIGAMVEAGVPIDEAYNRASLSIPILGMRKRFSAKLEFIRQGSKFHIICSDVMPVHILPLLQAGEASGKLAQSLIHAANLLDKEMDHALKRLTSLVEPAMMVGMGGMVGSIALSIMMPIYDISKTLQH